MNLTTEALDAAIRKLEENKVQKPYFYFVHPEKVPVLRQWLGLAEDEELPRDVIII